MFIISKLVEFLLLPSNLIGFLAGVGLVALVLRRPRFGRAALVLAALLLMVGGWSPLGRAALMALEDRFPQPQLTEPIAGIVMLGGAVDTHITAERGQATLNEAGERITAVAELSRRFPQARLLLSGGASDLASAEPVTESAIARDLLVRLGAGAATDRARRALAHHLRERGAEPSCCQAQGGRPLAARYLGEPHAARGRLLPGGRVRGNSLSG